MKRTVVWALVAFGVWWVVEDPASAAGPVHAIGQALSHAASSLAGINSAVAKDPNAITFPTEIHRDGPGHLAVVDLPYGVEAADVIARRGRLASGLRLPLDQVWPEPAPGHTGRLALWVGHEPASQMRQPAWPLLRGGTVNVFKPFPFATTPRMEVTEAALAFRNWLFGGQPGSGKSWAMRLLVLAAALDVRVELRGYELKGVGDFAKIGPVCAEYGNGNAVSPAVLPSLPNRNSSWISSANTISGCSPEPLGRPVPG